jgi:uncharacterized protein (DUF58 family)
VARPIATTAFGRFARLAFVSRRAARAGLGGDHRSRRRSPSTDFVDFRPYQPGDDFRRVDWNVYGRLGTLQVKLTEGREQLDIVLVLDCSSSMAYGDPDKLTFGAQLVAALSSVGMARADAVRITCLAPRQAGRFGPFGRRGRLPEVVGHLSQLVPTGRLDINASLADCLPADGTQPLVVVVSDLLTPDTLAVGLDALQRRGADVVVVHVIAPQEHDPRLAGELELVDAETEEVLQVGVSLETLAAYRARFAGWVAEREAACRERAMRYVAVQSDTSLETVMLDDLRRAGVLR